MTPHLRIPARLPAVAAALVLAVAAFAGGLAASAAVPTWVVVLMLGAVVPLAMLFRAQDQRAHGRRDI